jgi:iron complex transport system ATP-binding protein
LEEKFDMLKVRDLSVLTGKIKILDGVSFDASPGEILGILGPNGSGKSTLIRTILGLVTHRSGKVIYNDGDVSALNPKLRARLFSYVPQNTPQNSLYTVLECVLMGRYPHLKRFEHYSARDTEIALASLARVGLSGFENRIVSTLSGDEAARVAYARAITQDSPVMLLDEPTSALDPKHSIRITSLMRELSGEGRLIIISLHDINLAINNTDKLILLKHGRIYGERRSRLMDEIVLGDLYDTPWEIWSAGGGEQLVAIPGK